MCCGELERVGRLRSEDDGLASVRVGDELRSTESSVGDCAPAVVCDGERSKGGAMWGEGGSWDLDGLRNPPSFVGLLATGD